MHSAIRSLTKVPRFLPLVIRPVAACLVFIASNTLAIADDPRAIIVGYGSADKDNRFETPEATIRTFRNAVKHRRWRDEYECYTGTQQAQFTYHLMVSTREISDSKDLAPKVARLFQDFQIPSGLLNRFPSMRVDLGANLDDQQIQAVLDAQASERKLRMERWQQEVQPLNIDWAGLIDELQPIFLKNYARHKNTHHPSQSGIVSHLDYHTFDAVKDLEIRHDTAKGMIVARLRDTNALVQDEVASGTWNPTSHGKSALANLKDRLLPVSLRAHTEREASEISFIRQPDGWKIAMVSFR